MRAWRGCFTCRTGRRDADQPIEGVAWDAMLRIAVDFFKTLFFERFAEEGWE